MGYSTTFDGELKFVNELKTAELVKLKSMLAEDCRDHPEWGNTNLTYIDLELTDDLTGLKWDGSEKTYNLPEKINLIIKEMRKSFPESNFMLSGELLASGESAGDVWRLVIENGAAVEKKIEPLSKNVTCPKCGEHFIS